MSEFKVGDPVETKDSKERCKITGVFYKTETEFLYTIERAWKYCSDRLYSSDELELIPSDTVKMDDGLERREKVIKELRDKAEALKYKTLLQLWGENGNKPFKAKCRVDGSIVFFVYVAGTISISFNTEFATSKNFATSRYNAEVENWQLYQEPEEKSIADLSSIVPKDSDWVETDQSTIKNNRAIKEEWRLRQRVEDEKPAESTKYSAYIEELKKRKVEVDKMFEPSADPNKEKPAEKCEHEKVETKRHVRIALNMLDDLEIDKKTSDLVYMKLGYINDLCEREGGKLASRQVIAQVIMEHALNYRNGVAQ